MNNFWNTQSNFTLISLITFEVLLQTLHNLQGSRRITIQWCLQNYIVNGLEFTSELTSKWIYILKYSSKFTTNLTNNLRSTRSNFTNFSGQSPLLLQVVPAKLHENRLRIDWDISENWVKIMTKMPRDQWKRIADSGFVAKVTVLAFLSFFVWRLLTSESDVKSHQTVQIGCFTSPSIRGISEKQSFLVYFQLGIIT